MIFTLILNIFYIAILVVFSPLLALPVATLSSNFADSMTTATSYLSAFNAILPVNTAVDLMAYTISFEAGYFLFKGIMWLVKRLPTQS